jgi:hypothetical protein
MRRLFGRLIRAERVLRALPPRDPRQDLPPEAVARADAVLDRLGADRAAAIAPEDAAWFEATIRPLLPRWLTYAGDLHRWHERRAAMWRAAEARRRDEGLPAPDTVFSGNALQALRRLLVSEPATPVPAMVAG